MTIVPGGVDALHDSAQGWFLEDRRPDSKDFGILTAQVAKQTEPLNQLAFVYKGLVLSGLPSPLCLLVIHRAAGYPWRHGDPDARSSD